MSKITVLRLKEKLQEVIDTLENNFEDNDIVNTVSNTYFCGPEFIALGSNGFVDLNNIDVEEPDEEDDD